MDLFLPHTRFRWELLRSWVTAVQLQTESNVMWWTSKPACWDHNKVVSAISRALFKLHTGFSYLYVTYPDHRHSVIDNVIMALEFGMRPAGNRYQSWKPSKCQNMYILPDPGSPSYILPLTTAFVSKNWVRNRHRFGSCIFNISRIYYNKTIMYQCFHPDRSKTPWLKANNACGGRNSQAPSM